MKPDRAPGFSFRQGRVQTVALGVPTPAVHARLGPEQPAVILPAGLRRSPRPNANPPDEGPETDDDNEQPADDLLSFR